MLRYVALRYVTLHCKLKYVYTYKHIHIHIIYIYTTYCTRITSEGYVNNSCMILIIRFILFWTRVRYSCMSQSRLLGEGRAIPPHTYHVPTGPVVVPPSLRATRT